MDLIEKLPLSSSYTLILVIVDHLSKQSLFIHTHNTITSQQLAQLFILHIFSKHGVPSHITSDCGMEFVSHFSNPLEPHWTWSFTSLPDILPKVTDKPNKLIRLWNSTYKSMYCNYQQDNWFELLPLAEFSYNNTLSATTGITPFFANKGYHPNLTVHPKHDLASAHAHNFVTDLDELHQQLQQHIAEAQCRYQTSADSRWLPAPEFKFWSQVFVKAQYFRTTRPSKKLSSKFLSGTDFRLD